MARVILAVTALLAVLAVCVQAQDADCMAKQAEYTAACKSELKLSDDDIAAMDQQPPFPAKTKCLIKCIAEKFGVFRNNRLVDNKIVGMIRNMTLTDPARRQKEIRLYNQCRTILIPNNACETAARMYACALRGARALGLTGGKNTNSTTSPRDTENNN